MHLQESWYLKQTLTNFFLDKFREKQKETEKENSGNTEDQII